VLTLSDNARCMQLFAPISSHAPSAQSEMNYPGPRSSAIPRKPSSSPLPSSSPELETSQRPSRLHLPVPSSVGLPQLSPLLHFLSPLFPSLPPPCPRSGLRVAGWRWSPRAWTFVCVWWGLSQWWVRLPRPASSSTSPLGGGPSTTPVSPSPSTAALTPTEWCNLLCPHRLSPLRRCCRCTVTSPWLAGPRTTSPLCGSESTPLLPIRPSARPRTLGPFHCRPPLTSPPSKCWSASTVTTTAPST
jgi:hypothetical protein